MTNSKCRPQRSEAVASTMHNCTLRVRQNIAALIEAEVKSGTEHPLTYHQLGKKSGYSSAIIYQTLTSEPPRNNIGMQTIARLGLALGVTPYELLMPPKSFKRDVVPMYLKKRGLVK